MAEDETKIKNRVSWDNRTDTLSGFCGSVENHKCMPGFEVVVSDEEEGYINIVESFQDCRGRAQ